MGSILDKIFADKKTELEDTKRATPLAKLKDIIGRREAAMDVPHTLRREPGGATRVIAEIKRKSPFKGELRKDFDALAIAKIYADSGAAALSVLTESKYFGGSLDVLFQVRAVVDIPLVRKDFIFADYQVYEARAFGADAFLLIATWLEKNQLADLMHLGREMGLTALVETHHEKDLEKAFAAGATLIGINNRDLSTGKTDLNISRRLLRMATMDPNNILVCESGINAREEIEEFEKLGADAFLVGESLVTAGDISAKLRGLLNG
jgi:indole-3-glycerol phosphate synthase